MHCRELQTHDSISLHALAVRFFFITLRNWRWWSEISKLRLNSIGLPGYRDDQILSSDRVAAGKQKTQESAAVPK